MIKGYCRNGNAEKADQILQELEKACGSDVMSMAVCLDTWSKTTDCYDKAIPRAEFLLNEIIKKYRGGLIRPDEKQVNSWVFESVARLWSRSRRAGSGDEIIALIRKMEDVHIEVPGYFFPTENLYILALDGITTTDRNAGPKALDLLNEMQILAGKGLLPTPNLRILSTVVASLAKSSGRGSVRRACEVYQMILQRYEDGELDEQLNPRTLSTLFRSILRATDKESGKLAMEILRKTSDFARKHPTLIAPNTIVFNTILDGLARKELPDEAWETIELMISLSKEGFQTQPDVVSYSCTARALASTNTPLTLKRIDALLLRVLEVYEKGDLMTDIELFNRILIAYKNSCSLHEEAAKHAHDLLWRLEDLCQKDDKLTPDHLSYRTVCEALCKSKIQNASSMLEDVYLRARSLSKQGRISNLDRELCYAAISSYARSLDEESLEKAEAVLEEMELRRSDHQQRPESPNTRVYNRMLFAYANSGQANQAARAQKIFEQMKAAFDNGDKDSQPNIHSYNSVRSR